MRTRNLATNDASTDVDTKKTSTVPPKPMKTRRKAAAEVRVLRNHEQTTPAKTTAAKTRPGKKVKDKENVASVANQQQQDENQPARKRGRAVKVPVLDYDEMVKTRGAKTTQEVQPPARKKQKGLKETVTHIVANEKESDVMQMAMNVSVVLETLPLPEITERRGRTRAKGNSSPAAVKVVEIEEKKMSKKKERDAMNASVVIEPLPDTGRRVRARAKVNPDPITYNAALKELKGGQAKKIIEKAPSQVVPNELVIIEKLPTRTSRRKGTLNTEAVTLELQDKKKETKTGKSVQSLNKRE